MGGPLQAQVDTAVVLAAAWAGCTKSSSGLHFPISAGVQMHLKGVPARLGRPLFL